MPATALATPILQDLHDFVAWLEPQEAKFEFVEGRLVAMAGGTLNHGIIQANLVRELGIQLRGTRCRPFTSDTLLRTDARERRGRFPDASVTCTAQPSRHWIVNPVALFEVLSAESERIDRGEKWLEYKAIASLEHYVLIAQDTMRVEHYRRDGAQWRYADHTGAEATLTLDPPGLALCLADLYEGVDFGEEDEAAGLPPEG